MAKWNRAQRAFTLIELIITVVIISILAVVALPNLRLASTRAKISRVEADFRTISNALETYHADNAMYPDENDFGTTPTRLSTPVAYVAQPNIRDPFYTGEQVHPQESYYRYNGFGGSDAYSAWHRKLYGHYWNYSNPPFSLQGRWEVSEEFSSLVPYDATNGVISSGRLIRGQYRRS